MAQKDRLKVKKSGAPIMNLPRRIRPTIRIDDLIMADIRPTLRLVDGPDSRGTLVPPGRRSSGVCLRTAMMVICLAIANISHIANIKVSDPSRPPSSVGGRFCLSPRLSLFKSPPPYVDKKRLEARAAILARCPGLVFSRSENLRGFPRTEDDRYRRTGCGMILDLTPLIYTAGTAQFYL